MANFYAAYPGVIGGSNASVAPNGGAAASSSTLIAGDAPGSIQTPVSVDASGNINVNVVSGSGPSTVTANQGTPAVIANAWPIEIVGSGNIASVTAANAVKVDGSAVTQPISAVSLPLPAGAATNAELVTINATLGSPFQAGGSIGNTSFIATQSSGANLHVNVDNFPATQPVSGTVAVTQSTSPWVDNLTQVGGSAIALGQALSAASFPVVIASNQSAVPISAASLPLPTGAATSANQTNASQKTQIVDGSGNVIASTSNALNVDVTNTVATSSPVNSNGSASSTTVSTAAAITKPANAIGFLLQNDAASTDYIRWTDSNSTASTTVGFVLQPGQDSGFVPMSHNLSICAHSGTQNYNIQWVLSS